MPLDTEARALIDEMQAASPPVETLTPDAARRASDERRARSALPVEDVWERVDRVVDTEEGPLRIRVYRPSAEPGLAPIVFFHGGGWVLCDLDSHDGLCRALANRIGAVLVSVEYRRAPESRYPTAVDDCYAATTWVAEHAGELGVDASRLAVMGDSAGGNLAAAVALMARDRSGPALALQALLYPVIADDFTTTSYRAFGTDHYLTRAAMQWYWDQYVPADRRHEPYASPIRVADVAGVTPAVVLIAECDPLHDEGLAYARRLADGGVRTAILDYAGGFHGFLSLGPVLQIAQRALETVAAQVRTDLDRATAGAGA